MTDQLTCYFPLISEEFNRYGLFFSPDKTAIALHKVSFFKENKSYQYDVIEANQMFFNIFNIKSIENFRYNIYFPQEKENKFDWSIVLGHSSEFYSTSMFNFYSEVIEKWFRFIVVSPRKGLALTTIEDINENKKNEIKLFLDVKNIL